MSRQATRAFHSGDIGASTDSEGEIGEGSQGGVYLDSGRSDASGAKEEGWRNDSRKTRKGGTPCHRAVSLDT